MSSKETAGSTDCLSINEVGGHRQREMAPCIILLLLFPGGLHAFHLGGGRTLHRAIFCIFSRRIFASFVSYTADFWGGGRPPCPPVQPPPAACKTSQMELHTYVRTTRSARSTRAPQQKYVYSICEV